MSERRADHWHRVAQLVRTIEGLPTNERHAALDALDENEEVLADVARVLNDDPETREFLSSPLVDPERNTLGEGARIGEFLLGQRLASGGMGTVYEATQDTPRRKVALKLMTSGLTTERARRRFEIEAEILAQLSHPGVAQIHASGVYRPPGGGFEIPWFAMELVDNARDVLTFAREERLPVRERLALFLEICEAVESGHARGVLHRDLKPSNVLVGGDGRVKVIDFGVARATSSGPNGDAATVTRTGEVFGTVTAMSPEQFLGDPRAIDVRTDVYSLGVMLYELLCAQPPYDLEGASLVEAARIVQDVAPVAPQTAQPGLERELAWVLMRALEKAPRDRYASVAAFADDITRHVQHEPVVAGPPSTWYRVEKFVRRHRATVAAGVLTAAALIVGTVVATLGLWEAEENLALAHDEIARTDRVNTFLNDLFLSVTPLEGGREVRVVELLDHARKELDESLEQDPVIRASLQHSLGGAYFDLGLYDESRELIEAALAHEIAHSPIGSPRRLDVERKALRVDYQTDAGAHVADDIRALITRCEEHLPDGHGVTMDAWRTLGEILSLESDLDGAIEALRAELAIRERHHAADTYTYDRRQSYLAFVLSKKGEIDEALATAEAAYERLRTVAGDNDTATLYAQGNLAKVWLDAGRYVEARDVFIRFGEALEKRLGPNHPHLLTNLTQIADCDMFIGDFETGYERAHTSLAAHRRILGDSAPSTLSAMGTLVSICMRTGRSDEAKSLLNETLEHYDDADHPRALTVRFNLARLRFDDRDHEGLLDVFVELIAACERVEGEAMTLTMASWTYVGHMLDVAGQSIDAETAYSRAVQLATAVFPDDHPFVLDYRTHRARSLVNSDRDGEASELIEHLIPLIEEQIRGGNKSIERLSTFLKSLRTKIERRADARENPEIPEGP